MTTAQILLALAVGLAVSEFSEVCPWAARKLVRWSAHRRYAPPAHAELRAEELAAYLDDRPGRLLKLITALGFTAAAIVTRRIAPGVAPPIPLWWPTTPVVPVMDYELQYNDDLGHTKALAIPQAWYQLTDEVRSAAKEVGVTRRSWRRCMKELRKITGDDRWTLVERNLDLLEGINNSCARLMRANSARWPHAASRRRVTPTEFSITHYQAGAETVRAEIRRLTSDFLISSAPR